MKKRHHCTLIGIATLPPVAACLALNWLGWSSASVIDQHVRLWVFGSFGIFCMSAWVWCLEHYYDSGWIYVPTTGACFAVGLGLATDLSPALMVFFEVVAVVVMLGCLFLALVDHWWTPGPGEAATPMAGEPQPVTPLAASPQPVAPQQLQQPTIAPENQRVGSEQRAAAGIGTDTGHVGRRLFLDEGPRA